MCQPAGRGLCGEAVRLATGQGTAVEHFVRDGDRNLGHLETRVAAHARKLPHQATAAGAQRKADALVIAAGAVWIGRLDFPHAGQHLVAVGRAVCGEDPTKVSARLGPVWTPFGGTDAGT